MHASRLGCDAEKRIVPSMGSVGDPCDDAMAESFSASLECELLNRRRFRSQHEASLAVFEYIEGFYNPQRRHSALDYLSPSNYEIIRFERGDDVRIDVHNHARRAASQALGHDLWVYAEGHHFGRSSMSRQGPHISNDAMVE